jgi:hypothetical protein
MFSESTVHLQLVLTDQHLLDDEFAAQISTLLNPIFFFKTRGMAHNRSTTHCTRNT